MINPEDVIADGSRVVADTLAAQRLAGIVHIPGRHKSEKDAADDVLLTAPADDDGNATCVYMRAGDRFLYTDGLGWLHWTGTHWQTSGAAAALKSAILDVLRERRLRAVMTGEKEAIVKATTGSNRRVNDAQALFQRLVTVSMECFDNNPDELNVANGVLNLRTGILRPHSPSDRFTYCLSTPYRPDADTTQWEAFLSETVADAEAIPYLQQVVGYLLTGHTSEECLWYIYGPPRSGKGTFTETLLHLLGKPLGTEVAFATFNMRTHPDSQNFDLAPLKPARLVVTSESNRHESLNTGKVKALTGGNDIYCAFKHRDMFSYRPQFKAVLVSNHPVNADVDDDALWYRVQVINFPHSRVNGEDKGLKSRLSHPDALAGLLRWAVEGARTWYQSPTGLVHPPSVREATRKQRAELDYVGAWLEERCEAGEFTSHATLYGDYSTWCKDSGVEPKRAKAFTAAVNAKGYASARHRLAGELTRGFEGVRLRPVL